MGSFEILDHTADVGIAARAHTRAELFAQVATGMFFLMVDLEAVEERETRDVEVQGRDPAALLVAWLDELIYLLDVEQMVFRRFDVQEVGDTRLRAICYGERAEAGRHQLHISPKGATYHMLEVAPDEGGSGWRAQVILDV